MHIFSGFPSRAYSGSAYNISILGGSSPLTLAEGIGSCFTFSLCSELDKHRLWFERMGVDFFLILAAFSCYRSNQVRISKLNISFSLFFGCWVSENSSYGHCCSLLFFLSYLRPLLTPHYFFCCSANRLSVRWHVVLFLYSLHSCHWPYSKFRNLAVLFVGYVHFHFGNFQLSFHGTCFCRFMSTRSLHMTEKCDSRVSLVQTSYLGSVPFSDHFQKSYRNNQNSNNFGYFNFQK